MHFTIPKSNDWMTLERNFVESWLALHAEYVQKFDSHKNNLECFVHYLQ